jgi:hypothetical protein
MTNEELEAKLESLQRQCDKLFSLHGLLKWPVQEKQRRDNAPRPLPTSHHQSHGQSNKPLAS